ncbi:MAG: response regulator [Candidatus Acidiferrales bacterium]
MADFTDVAAPPEKSAENQPSEPSAAERRRRLRTRISAPVRVRLNSGSAQQAEVCTTVDASRDGLLFTTAFAGYRPGMDLAITFPYSGTAGGVQHERTAVVARVFEMPEKRFGIGIRFYNGKQADEAAQNETIAAKAPPTAAGVAQDLPKPMPVILIVESDARTRNTLRFVLQNERYIVEAVETGAQAVEFLRQNTPSMLLTEIEIADMSGYDLCLIVKSNDRLRNVPVVMTTRRGQPNDYSTAHALGAIVCLAKPYKQERLLHVVRMLAPQGGSGPEASAAAENGSRHPRVNHAPAAHARPHPHAARPPHKKLA